MTKQKIRITILGSILLLVPLCALLLNYGNPQWCKWIYIYQTWVDDKPTYIPSNFTGTWRTWHKNGRREYKSKFEDGVRHGHVQMWYPSGSIRQESHFSHGSPTGLCLTYYDPERDGSTGVVDRMEYRAAGRTYSGFSESGKKLFHFVEDYETKTKIRCQWDKDGVLLHCHTNQMNSSDGSTNESTLQNAGAF